MGDVSHVWAGTPTQPGIPSTKWRSSAAGNLVQKGLAVIAGDDPDIMEAAKKEAFEAGGTSLGLNASLPTKQSANPYQAHNRTFRYFFVGKIAFAKHTCRLIVLPSGFGTMDKFFGSMTLI